MMRDPVVFVVDDNADVRESLTWLLESVGLTVQAFSTAGQFLEEYDPDQPGCLVLDVRMPGMSGLELQEELTERGIRIPVIIITGHADVSMAVRAMKSGAMDFIEKPFNDQALLDRVNRAIEHDAKQRSQHVRVAELTARIDLLTAREREVMDMVVVGKPNREIAELLGVTSKTVEAHRAKIMEKMEASSLADLVRMVVTCTGV